MLALVRESIAYPYMDFKKSTDINMDIHQYSIIYTVPVKSMDSLFFVF